MYHGHQEDGVTVPGATSQSNTRGRCVLIETAVGALVAAHAHENPAVRQLSALLNSTVGENEGDLQALAKYVEVTHLGPIIDLADDQLLDMLLFGLYIMVAGRWVPVGRPQGVVFRKDIGISK